LIWSPNDHKEMHALNCKLNIFCEICATVIEEAAVTEEEAVQ